MPVDGPVHTNRARAESFGSVAAAYDRYRPGYPPELIDDLAGRQPRAVLDIGCGTGKAARLLAERGLATLGVEIDPEMAAVARSHGLDVEVSSFEEWDDAGRQFDLIVSAQAWHWVDPKIALPKVARVLTMDGTLAFFWNYDDADQASQAVVDDVYRDVAPELLGGPAHTKDIRAAWLADLRATGAFRSVTTRTYKWQRALRVEEWVGKAATQSDHLV
ncbi:MAG TPA: class I SAM-dependent methyltransferase, partial [Mycobacteriales bacterium]|nr:class I SAM-dependent methyltransferase [Mycobacteriales bacterium]